MHIDITVRPSQVKEEHALPFFSDGAPCVFRLAFPRLGIRPRQTRNSPEGLEPPLGICQRTTSRKIPGQWRDSGFQADLHVGHDDIRHLALLGLIAEAPTQGAPL